jgi:hypothetical protein
MNIFELFVFALMVGFCIWLSWFLVGHVGWAGVLPGLLLGFAVIAVPLGLLRRRQKKPNTDS